MWQEVKAIRGKMDDLIAPKMAIIMRLQKLFPTETAARSHPRFLATHHPPVLSAQCSDSKGCATVVTSPQMKTLMKGLTFVLRPSSSIKIPFLEANHISLSSLLARFWAKLLNHPQADINNQRDHNDWKGHLMYWRTKDEVDSINHDCRCILNQKKKSQDNSGLFQRKFCHLLK